MPHNNNNHANISLIDDAPDEYFNYANVSNIKFYNINAVYGNAKSLNKTNTMSINKLQIHTCFILKYHQLFYLINLDSSKIFI